MYYRRCVSVSLRSIIHSYLHIDTLYNYLKDFNSFRLLTEYHSFLFCVVYDQGTETVSSFRLLTEYHSFLLGYHMLECTCEEI